MGYVPLSLGGAYPGLYLFTSPARFVRPVKNLVSLPDGEPRIELIGPFEQVSFDQLLHSCISSLGTNITRTDFNLYVRHLWRYDALMVRTVGEKKTFLQLMKKFTLLPFSV